MIIFLRENNGVLNMHRPILQVALDLINWHRAKQIAMEAVDGGVDWIEAGTPLIKSEGMAVIRQLKKIFQSHVIVADMKTMDVGGLEVEMASKSGADVICVMGAASDETIGEAVKAAKRYNSKIMVDLLGVKNKKERGMEVKKLGVHYLCVHVSIDKQMVGENPLEALKEVAGIGMPIAVAGGLNSETAAEVVKAGASIIIVGGAITKSTNIKKAAATIKKAMIERKAIKSDLFKRYKEEELYEAFKKVSTPNINDAMHKKGSMIGLIPRINHNVKMVGKAVTVQTLDGDWAKPVEAVDMAKKGNVIVIDASKGQKAVWGELASWSCKVKGIEGVVIDGAARDLDSILEMNLPLFSRHISSCAGEPKGYGEIGGKIVCGGEEVNPGDWIVGDESGVIVIPKEIAVEIANRALDVLERENRIREEIQRGSTLSKVLNVKKWEKV